MKRKSIAFMTILVLTLSMFLSGCGTKEAAKTEAPKNNVIKIGYIASMSGQNAYVGLPGKLALEDYVKDLNAKGGLLGKQVQLIAYDVAISTSESVNAVNRLIQQDKVVAILGPTGSAAAIPLAPIVNDAKVPVVAISATNVKVTVGDSGKAHPYMFRVCLIDPYQGSVLADFAYKDQGLRKIACLSDVSSPYAQGIQQFFITRFKQLGGEISSIQGYLAKDVEFRAQISNIKQTSSEAIFVPAVNYGEAGMIAKQSKALGANLKLLLTDGSYAKELLDVAGTELEGSYIMNGLNGDDPMFDAYKKEFTQKHPDSTANAFVFYALDAMKAVEYAINKAGSADPVAIRDQLETMKDVPVATGTITMEPDTHNPHNKPVTIFQIKDKQYKVYKVYSVKD